MTDTMGRMHSDAQFAGSSSVPAHVEMMDFLGMGNNPMVIENLKSDTRKALHPSSYQNKYLIYTKLQAQ